ncbi:MAG: hypothetical protein LUQ12_00380 [Methanoregulaceae archaeon]|nr:hypothetical protein [Methanoregulaceae archaeon]
MDEKPCCTAEALRRITRVDVGGVVVGIAMLDPILKEVEAMKRSGEREIGDELLKRVKMYNYIPPRAEEEYRTALMREYRKSQERGV